MKYWKLIAANNIYHHKTNTLNSVHNNRMAAYGPFSNHKIIWCNIQSFTKLLKKIAKKDSFSEN